jgi:hypothetical protein
MPAAPAALMLMLIDTLSIQGEAEIAKDFFPRLRMIASRAANTHGTQRESSLAQLRKERTAFGASASLGTYQAKIKNCRHNFPCRQTVIF